MPDVYAARQIDWVILMRRGGYRLQTIATSNPDSRWSPGQDDRADYVASGGCYRHAKSRFPFMDAVLMSPHPWCFCNFHTRLVVTVGIVRDVEPGDGRRE